MWVKSSRTSTPSASAKYLARVKRRITFPELGEPYDKSKLSNSPTRVLTLWSVNFGLTNATGVDNAYRTSLAKRMDNIDANLVARP